MLCLLFAGTIPTVVQHCYGYHIGYVNEEVDSEEVIRINNGSCDESKDVSCDAKEEV